jgi:predicted RNA binding protein YcfA (HicA-like mRNA interferase family)
MAGARVCEGGTAGAKDRNSARCHLRRREDRRAGLPFGPRFCQSHLTYCVLSPYFANVTAREVIRRLLQRDAIEVRQRGSHKRFVSACRRCATTVAMHAGDIPAGTLRAIERDMEPCCGKGWLRG